MSADIRPPVDQWEYHTRFLTAKAEDEAARNYLRKQYPTLKPGKYAPQVMEIALNELGRDGWELILLQPIKGVGRNWDVSYRGDGAFVYSNHYFTSRCSRGTGAVRAWPAVPEMWRVTRSD